MSHGHIRIYTPASAWILKLSLQSGCFIIKWVRNSLLNRELFCGKLPQGTGLFGFEITNGTSHLIPSKACSTHASPCNLVIICFAGKNNALSPLYLLDWVATTLMGRYYYFHFTHEENEAKKLSNFPKLTALERISRNSKLSLTNSRPFALYDLPHCTMVYWLRTWTLESEWSEFKFGLYRIVCPWASASSSKQGHNYSTWLMESEIIKYCMWKTRLRAWLSGRGNHYVYRS